MAAFEQADRSQSDKKAPGQENLFSDQRTEDDDPPSEKFINWFLQNAGVGNPSSLLHRVGVGPDDVASAKHTHDGKNSGYLFDSAPALADLPASPTNAQIVTAVNGILAILRSRGVGQ